MRIAIMGGTFSPPHIGHLIVADHVAAELRLDKIVFVPAAVPPHKLNDDIVSSAHRLQMLKLAVQGNDLFDVSDIELHRGGVSFTVDTLRSFTEAHPEDDYFLLIGMDNLIDFHTWKSPDEILRLATVVVMTRPGFDIDSVPALMKDRVSICGVPAIDISSRNIRERLHLGRTIKYRVTGDVEEYIYHNGLYGSKPGITSARTSQT